MAFFTFAEAKVVAPPIVPMNNIFKIEMGSLFGVGYDAILDPFMRTQYDAIINPVMMTQS